MKKFCLTIILSAAFIFSALIPVLAAPVPDNSGCTNLGGTCRPALCDSDETIGPDTCIGTSVCCLSPGPVVSPAPASPNPTVPVKAGCQLVKGQQVCTLENPLQGDKTDATAIISTVIKGALGIIGALTLLMLVWGGFQWLTSAGNPEKVKMGTQTMVWAVIGVVLVFASYVLLSTFTGYLTGRT